MKTIKAILLAVIIQLLVITAIQQNTFVQLESVRYNYLKREPLPYIYGWPVMDLSEVQQILNPLKDTTILVRTQNNYLQLCRQYQNQCTPIANVENIPKDAQLIVFGQQQDILKYSFVAIASGYFKVFTVINNTGQIVNSFQTVLSDSITATTLSEDQSFFYAGTEKLGLYKIEIESGISTKVKDLANIKQLSLSFSLNILAVVTDKVVWLWQVESNQWRYELIKSFTKNIDAINWRQTDNSLWIGGVDNNSITIFEFTDKLSDNKTGFSQIYNIWRVGVLQGLPIGSVQFIDSCKKTGKMFLGGEYGVAFYNSKLSDILPNESYSNYHSYQGVDQIASQQSPWQYFYQQRWLASGPVEAMTYSHSSLFVSTTYGFATISQRNLTFDEKAAIFQQEIKERFLKLNYVVENKLKHPADVLSGVQNQDDNEGMWNNMYMVSQSYLFKATKDNKAKERAWQAFQAQQRLYAVIPEEFYGLMAKAVDYYQPLPGSLWYYSDQPGYEEFIYKSNASSDDVTSYFYAFPIFLEYVCETQQQKDMVIKYILRTMDYIMENNYQMLNVDGKKTHWGFWNPENLNDNPEYYSERCLNSVEIIAYLSVAYKYSGKQQKYLDAIYDLGNNHQYFQNIINWRYITPQDVNFSDDELGYLALQAFFFVADAMPEDIVDLYRVTLYKTWSVVQEYQPSLYTFQTLADVINDSKIKNIVSQEQIDFAYEELQNWPMEWINLPYDNQHRLDVQKMRNPIDKYLPNQDMMNTIRRNERFCGAKWNSNVYELTQARSGDQNDPATPWLLPYYMSVYLNNTDTQEIQKFLS